MKKIYKAYGIIAILIMISGYWALLFELGKIALITYIIDKAVEHHTKK